MNEPVFRVALLWHGDRKARSNVDLEASRFRAVAEALRSAGIRAEPVDHNDDFLEDARQRLDGVDGVLVWVNPIEQGGDQTQLDGLLREVAEAGVAVSAHPDTILKMGTREVLYQTRDMSWGTDIHLYSTIQDLRERLPLSLQKGKPRVLKQYRGNGGNGVWKVESNPDEPQTVSVRHALRGSLQQELPMNEFYRNGKAISRRASDYYIDQEYQERLTYGMIRCYLSGDQVVGFGHQQINALFPAPSGSKSCRRSPTGSPTLLSTLYA